jgi:transcription elongation factor GreA
LALAVGASRRLRFAARLGSLRYAHTSLPAPLRSQPSPGFAEPVSLKRFSTYYSANYFCYHDRVKAKILKKFADEIQQLDRELKTELPKEIKRARELGDLRENAEYQAAKERQRLVESRISLLQKRVSEISLMNLDRLPKDKVGFGSTVTLRDEAGQTVVYQLVMPEDANVDEGLISTASPIGRALLNKEEGADVTVRTPNGVERHFEITKLLTIHDE